MQNIWKWILRIALALIILLILPFAWSLLLPNGGYNKMMGYGYGWHMPMMYGGGMMGFGMLFIWLISLVLIGLGVVWLVKAFSAPK